MIDSSESVRVANFNITLDFVTDLIVNEHTKLGPDGIQVGILSYYHLVTIHFHMNEYTDNHEFEKAVKAIPYTQGSTNTSAGIR